jgi:hypothetical protein
MTTAAEIENELASLGLDDSPEDSIEEPSPEDPEGAPVETPPFVNTEGAPAEEPVVVQTNAKPLDVARTLVAALDRLQGYVAEVRDAAQALCDVLDPSSNGVSETAQEPTPEPPTEVLDEPTDEGDDEDASVPQER